MTLITMSRLEDHGEYFGAETRQIFADALVALRKEKPDTTDKASNDINFLNALHRRLTCWASNFTLRPRETLGGSISGLTSENAEPVYRALDDAVDVFNGVTTNGGLAGAEREAFAERLKRGLEAFANGDDMEPSIPLPELRRFVELGVACLQQFRE